MAFEIDNRTARWLIASQVANPQDIKQVGNSMSEIREPLASQLQNGTKIALLIATICRKRGLPVPQTLAHLKTSTQTAAQLYNWNILNDTLRKFQAQIDPETKNLIINGDRDHLALVLRKLNALHDRTEDADELDDSLETEKMKHPLPRQASRAQEPLQNAGRQSLTLSRSQEAPTFVPLGKRPNELQPAQKRGSSQFPLKNARQGKADGDLLEWVLGELQASLKLSRKQAIALLSDNNKYLAHVFVKGVKGEFAEIEELLEKWFGRLDWVVQRMTEQNDMCFFFLQVVKPTLLSKSEEVAQWGCRILSRIAYDLANRQMLPLAYDWFIREAGGLSTTILALTRHPKLNQHVVSFILQFARYNVAQLFTVQLRKITSNDQVGYIKFMLLIFDPLVQSKLSAEELLNSGAIDYWVETCLKGSQQGNTMELRLYSMEFLTKMWRAYPLHIEQALDKVNQIMGYIKRGIREGSQIMRFTLLELLFNLLDEFASKRNPYASIVYKKLTFLFIENHQELDTREFMLRNFAYVISKYQTIPLEIFLEPFVKQIKTRQSKSYILNIFDMQFMNAVVPHKKLKAETALQLFDLLAKTKLSSYPFAAFADPPMQHLLDRFLDQQSFFAYAVKLVKISFAMFYSTLKHKKNQRNMSDQERLNAQKRAQIINFVISLVERQSSSLNDEIKNFAIHLKIQIQSQLGVTHKGIERILSFFPNSDQDLADAVQQLKGKQRDRDEIQSNMVSQGSKDNFHLPKIQPKYLSKDKDEVSSQQSFQSQGTKYSRGSKQEFPQKDYTKFAEEDEQKFMKQNFKKKQIKRPVADKEVDPKVQEQILKTKLRKQQQERKKIEQQQRIEKRKQILKSKIQKQLQQRTLMQGVKGIQKDVQVKVLFQQNEINEKLLEEQQPFKQMALAEEENRDSESVKLILKKYSSFLKKLFNRYATAKVNKKDYFQSQGETMAQLDLIRLCKEKNLQKNKQSIVDLLRTVNDKNLKNLTVQSFFKFLQAMTVYLFLKEKCSTHFPMGDFLRQLLKRMAVGQNFKLEEDQDEQSKVLTEKVRYNPHVQLPDNYKKIYERVYEPKKECSYPVKKAVNREAFTTCFEVVNDLLFKIFKVNPLEEQVRFFEEARVVSKKNQVLPPRPARRQREEPVSLLQEKQEAPLIKNKRAVSNLNKPALTRANDTNVSVQKQKENSRPKLKIVNAVQKKRLEEQQAKRLKKQQEQQEFKKRQLQIKKRVQKMQQEKQKQKSKQKEDTKAVRQQDQQKKKRQKEQKEKYQKQQKEKLQRYKREREQKDKQEKQKQKQSRQKEQEQKKQKLKQQMKKQQEKRRQQQERAKRQKEVSEQKNKKKKQDEQKKKEVLKKQVLKKLQGEKQKYEIQKMYKELMKKIQQEPDIQELFGQYKQELRSMFNYGKEYNEYKLGDNQAHNNLQQRGWMTVCQQFNLCDMATSNNLLKQNQKQKGRNGLSYEDLLEQLLSLAVKKDIENELQDYDRAHKAAKNKLQKYLKGLKIPKDKQSIKDYFVNLKNTQKKREQVQVVAPNGEKETWEIEEK